MEADKPIGILDSGLGGLSLLREIRIDLPNENRIYVADSAFAPYGDKSIGWITDRSAQIIAFLIEQGCKAVVIACNTITAVAVQALRARFSVPIIAMEPAIKPAVAITRSGVVAVMATTRTLQSENLQYLRRKYGVGVEVLFVPCPGLADMVEIVELNTPELETLLRSLLGPALDQGVDTLVLGCTHYPFLVDVIRRVVGPDVAIVDPSAAVSMELKRRLQTLNLLTSRSSPGSDSLWTSDALTKTRERVGTLLGFEPHIARLPDLGEISTFVL